MKKILSPKIKFSTKNFLSKVLESFPSVLSVVSMHAQNLTSLHGNVVVTNLKLISQIENNLKCSVNNLLFYCIHF